MNEITEITDFIQDEAGATADVIWGHGYDATLGDKLSVTLIATGFKSNPITGFEKAPERKMSTLEDEPKNEIKAPLSSPTQVNTFSKAVEVKAVEEPFLKDESTSETPSFETKTEFTSSFSTEKTVEANEMNFDWDVIETSTTIDSNKEDVVRFMLEDDMEQKVSLENVNSKTILSPEDQQRRTQDRLSKIQEYTAKLKKADGIAEFENEPAYVRRNIQLANSTPSTDEQFSRFGLSEDENGTTLRSNNFLHDNVD